MNRQTLGGIAQSASALTSAIDAHLSLHGKRHKIPFDGTEIDAVLVVSCNPNEDISPDFLDLFVTAEGYVLNVHEREARHDTAAETIDAALEYLRDWAEKDTIMARKADHPAEAKGWTHAAAYWTREAERIETGRADLTTRLESAHRWMQAHAAVDQMWTDAFQL